MGGSIRLELVAALSRNTQERIRQIEAKALDKLRLPSRVDHLKDFMVISNLKKNKEPDNGC